MDVEKPDTADNRREFSRVEVVIPFEYKLLPAEERGNIRSRVLGTAYVTESCVLPDVQDPVLSQWLKMLNDKLDTIIRLVNMHREGFRPLVFRPANLSGSGMSFACDERFSRGDILEIRMILSAVKPVVVCLYGTVTKETSLGKRFCIAVRFLPLEDAVRDEIVRFVFERERELIRAKKGPSKT